jgi:Zn-dependent peptidase ImmA (M78 family)/transcriptional regulator with XRE-family HTH domain
MSRFNYAMMELAREAAGLSQEALAESVGSNQATISRWEHGLFVPSDDEISRLARALRVPQSFFRRTDVLLGAGLPVFYHRSLTAASARVTATVNARCFVRAMQIDALAKLSPPPENQFRELPASDFATGPIGVAQAIRAAWGLMPGPLHDLTGLLESKGAIVVVEDLGCDEVDALCWWRAGLPKLFFVNARKPACRMRFSLAHEVGHTLMHADPMDPPVAEKQADSFAGEFLFPEKEVRAAIRPPLSLARLAAMKPWWKMSMSAIAVRARESGVISSEQLASLMKELGARGWRKREPVDIPVERPTRLGRMLHHALTVLDLTRDELARILNTTEDDLEQMIRNHQWMPAEEPGVTAESPYLRLVS